MVEEAGEAGEAEEEEEAEEVQVSQHMSGDYNTLSRR
jgi:hypothetical protein